MNADLRFEEHVPLAPLTTMGVGGTARYLARIRQDHQIPGYVAWAKGRRLPLLVLGEGSNMVVADTGFPGVVLKMETVGIRQVENSAPAVQLRASAGVGWDHLVRHTIENGWWGLENMSLIPGTVGACPVQNVGAYGQECRSVIVQVRAYDLVEECWVTLNHRDCRFAFRSSIFNTSERGRYLISAVDFRLSLIPSPCLSRAAVRHRLQSEGCRPRSQVAIRNAVIGLRTEGRLLPAPETLGSAGTFFRPGIVPQREFLSRVLTTCKRFGPRLALRLLACGWKHRSRAGIKVPSRILIDACDLQNLRAGSVALFPANPAVVVTWPHPPPAASDILKIIREVRCAVRAATGIEVPVEPSLVGFASEELRDAFEVARKASATPRAV